QKTINEMNHFLMIDLAYHNDQLISDPDLHFDRNCLTDAMAEKISAHPAVKDYIERYHESLEYPQVASAAKSILQFCRNQ
ncbi:MAG TPA: hypothetical protein VFM32_04805, partial [Spongiibacteraceae bacterium]|nr:hypothetical protein [Spongiibacteraceae bacterium]